VDLEWNNPTDASEWSALDALSEARVVIERVRDLHSPDDSNSNYGTVCSECLGPDEMQAPWPCATRAITDGVEQAPWPRWRGHAAG
jgi:hypothetical protein